MNRRFVFRRTCQLSRGERDNLRALFIDVFGKNLTDEHFDRKYLHTPLGYSYHGLMIVDGSVVGAYNAIPYGYEFFGTPRLFGLVVDTGVALPYRHGPFNVPTMANLIDEAMRQDGVGFLLDFPNDLAYAYAKRILGYKDIGELEFYVLPREIGAVVPRLRFATWFTRALVAGSVYLSQRGRAAECSRGIEKTCDKGFEKHRYGSQYGVEEVGDGGKCVFRICVEEWGVRVLYILDVCPLRADVYRQAVARLYARYAQALDIMLYVGKLAFSPRPLIRVPTSWRPCRVRVCGKILIPGVVDDRVFQMDNWSVNLSNFDVR